MARFPLALSAHPSAWTADAETGKRGTAAAVASCQFCGQPTAGWQEPFHLNDDHADDSVANIAASCPLCHLPQHLNRPEIDREAVLIWLPEMAQGAVNVLARQIHLACKANGLTPVYEDLARRSSAVVSTSAAYHAYRTLFERAAAADLRLGTTSPRHLGATLRELPPADYERRSALLGGIRLLPVGRLFDNGRDIYPDMLRDWAPPGRPPA